MMSPKALSDPTLQTRKWCGLARSVVAVKHKGYLARPTRRPPTSQNVQATRPWHRSPWRQIAGGSEPLRQPATEGLQEAFAASGLHLAWIRGHLEAE